MLHPYFHEGITEDPVKSLNEANINIIQCFIFTHRSSFTAKGYHIGQACPCLHKSQLTSLNHLSVFGNGFWDNLFHYLLFRDWGEADRPVVPQSFLPFWKAELGITFVRNLSQSPRPFTDCQQWPHSDIVQLPLHLLVHSVRSHQPVCIWFV